LYWRLIGIGSPVRRIPYNLPRWLSACLFIYSATG
jgi:hypothetical protein